MIIKNHAKTCLIISAAIIVIALLMSIFGLGINLGIDFAGGTSLIYNAGEPADQKTVEDLVSAQGVQSTAITLQGENGQEINIRVTQVAEDEVNGIQAKLQEALSGKYPATTLVNRNTVGPVAGRRLVGNAIRSVLIAAVLMLIYIAIRFDLNSGLAAIFGLLHDVLMMLAFMVLLRSIIQMNSTFIAAMLTIVGYSINNTIVIFDRIRENVRKQPTANKVSIVNKSVRECLGRTINTTLTTLITIVMLYILGVASIKEFALPIIIGILSGVYSANMINGYVWAFLEDKRAARKAAAPKTAKA